MTAIGDKMKEADAMRALGAEFYSRATDAHSDFIERVIAAGGHGAIGRGFNHCLKTLEIVAVAGRAGAMRGGIGNAGARNGARR